MFIFRVQHKPGMFDFDYGLTFHLINTRHSILLDILFFFPFIDSKIAISIIPVHDPVNPDASLDLIDGQVCSVSVVMQAVQSEIKGSKRN